MDPDNDTYLFYLSRSEKQAKNGNESSKPGFKKETEQRKSALRMSLLGKPLNYNRASRRDARYRRLQSRVYNFLERPRGLPAILYHIMVFLMVFTCLALSVFSTIEEYEKEALYLLLRMEILVVIWFSLEFALRLWSSGCRSRYQGCMGRLKFMKRPFCIIDVITIAASSIVLGMGTSGQMFATSALRGLRFFQILRMVRMDRRGGTWKLLGSVVYAHRQELVTTMYIGFLGLIFASFLVYLMEKDVNEKFSNFAQALWWGVITLCTVGYGDMVPQTWQGKLIASFCALLGISFFALPAGILGSGFALKVQQQQRQKHMIRRRQPAATLIQAVWRCYAADEHFVSVATWKIHQVPLPSPPASRTSSSFKHNASFVARLPTIRRPKAAALQSAASPMDGLSVKAAHGGSATPTTRYMRTLRHINASVENLEVIQNGRTLNPSFSEDSVADTTCFKKNNNSDASNVLGSSNTLSLSDVARALCNRTPPRRRHSAQLELPALMLNGDVIRDDASDDDVETSSYIESAEAAGGFSSIPIVLRGFLQGDLFSSGAGEEHADGMGEERTHYIEPTQIHVDNRNYVMHSDGQYYERNDEDEPRCTQLQNQHKTAIRFIRKLKYFVARRKFKEALKPYDVKDVMEQYAAGHVDLLGRVKNLHARLDQILGKQGSKSKDAYASKISLASRVVKVERQVVDIEEKLDILLKAYMQDRERFAALPLPPTPATPTLQSTLKHSNTKTYNQAPLQLPSSAAQPPSLLLNKQKQQQADQCDSWERTNAAAARPPPPPQYADVIRREHLQPTDANQYHEIPSASSYAIGPGGTATPPHQQLAGAGVGGADGYLTDLGSRTRKRVTLRQVKEACDKPKLSLLPEVDILPAALGTVVVADSSIILMDEVEDEEEEEEDLNCEGELEPYPSWDSYAGVDDAGTDAELFNDDTTEDMALLTRRTHTAIVITPISPVSSAHNLTSLEDQATSSTSLNKKKSNLLSPDSGHT